MENLTVNLFLILLLATCIRAKFYQQTKLEKQLNIEVILQSLNQLNSLQTEANLNQIASDLKSISFMNKTLLNRNYLDRLNRQLNETWFEFCLNRSRECLEKCIQSNLESSFQKSWCQAAKKKYLHRVKRTLLTNSRKLKCYWLLFTIENLIFV